jgi:hypothetical protein
MNRNPGEMCERRRKTNAARREPPRQSLHALELLEARRLLSGATLGADGILTVTGTDDSDVLAVYRDRSDPTRLIVDAFRAGRETDWQIYYGYFNIADVRGIRIDGGGGADGLAVMDTPTLFGIDPAYVTSGPPDLRVDLPVTLNGGEGDDLLVAETDADNVIDGGAGYDKSWSPVREHTGHNLFAVEFITRPDPLQTDIALVRPSTFVWHGGEGEFFADPWEVPNHNGEYSGEVIPTFDNEADDDASQGGDSAQQDGGQAEQIIPVAPEVGPAESPSGQVVVMPPPVGFSTTPIDVAHHKVWDDDDTAD